jgi:hypothetical protein
MGAATRAGKTVRVKNGIMNGRFPIIICKNLHEAFLET